jgi:hypothetical protein
MRKAPCKRTGLFLSPQEEEVYKAERAVVRTLQKRRNRGKQKFAIFHFLFPPSEKRMLRGVQKWIIVERKGGGGAAGKGKRNENRENEKAVL